LTFAKSSQTELTERKYEMNIDYDGVNSVISEAVNKYESRLISVIVEAMDDGEITKVQIPFEWEICDVCRGNGNHSNRLGVINVDDWDDEELDGYFAGRYDVGCERCDGSGKIRVIAVDLLPEDVQQFVGEYRDGYSENLEERRSEMMWGC
jgi:hypothetical protein